MITRRTFLAAAAAVPVLAQATRPKRIAIITTIFRLQSHGQHIGDRFMVGYPFEGEWHKPNTQVVALYVDQKPEGDLSAARAKERAPHPRLLETFAFGMAIVVGSSFVYASALVGPGPAAAALAEGLLGLAIIMFIFVQELRRV